MRHCAVLSLHSADFLFHLQGFALHTVIVWAILLAMAVAQHLQANTLECLLSILKIKSTAR